MASVVSRSQFNSTPFACGGTGIIIMDVQRLLGAIVSIWTKISKNNFQDLVECVPQRINTVLKANGGLTWQQQGVTNNGHVKTDK